MKRTAAVIMAGGKGERLRPVTDTMPKPLVPIGNEPAIAASVKMLREADVGAATVTVKYRHEDIKKECGDVFGDVKLSYFIENEALGTAGGVRAAAETLGDYTELIVLSGDAVSDLSILRAVTLHRLCRAEATLMLTRSDEPWRYGVVGVDYDGRIASFEEKPQDAVPGALVNTGIYILSRRAIEMIPKGREYDFGRELFPMMLRRGEKMYGCEGEGYWCDVGTPEAYIECCRDAALGKIRGFSADVAPSGAITSAECRIGEDSILSGCVLHQGVTLGDKVHAKNSIFCRGVTVGGRVSIGDGCVIGADSYIGDGVRVPAGTKIAPNSMIESGAGIFAENL